ncbi:DUF4352 domain-containing protein [Rhodococcus opacus]|uniref:DUF4352 domain-containing protein n=1 Tax=Rhodococcus opacus TaxID=37919 RepID=UPI0007CD6D00|nr:DUF4352 domain-containing protein [Rhodococcus opacus]MDX5962265.1 DUF4352 domain-containing protein [Rhodococcus opacus]NKY74838.1 DUF4352 domain-containing protein [Rhodococcus opacus]CAG7641894.1 hypothetical protein E143388_08331 [Rhodococcus opacus]
MSAYPSHRANPPRTQCSGREFTNASGAEFSLDGEDEGDGDINPGITRSTRVVFDIPIGAAPIALEVHDSMFSNGARVSFG